MLQIAISERNDEVLARSVADVVMATGKTLTDAFPDLKKESCQSVLLVASLRDVLPDSGICSFTLTLI
jgi:hypothetical protein